MRKAMFLLLTLFFIVGGVEVFSQELSVVTVKSHELNNHVLILEIVKAGRTYELTCNEGLPGCNSLQNGRYVLVELPKNRGMYECRNVEIYPETTTAPEINSRLGNYCLAEK